MKAEDANVYHCQSIIQLENNDGSDHWSYVSIALGSIGCILHKITLQGAEMIT